MINNLSCYTFILFDYDWIAIFILEQAGTFASFDLYNSILHGIVLGKFSIIKYFQAIPSECICKFTTKTLRDCNNCF
jgi:hypothetical protein